jgi:hypothetical protein
VNIGEYFSDFERGLNFLGYFPGISTISGQVRDLYGSAELIAGLALSIFSALFGSKNSARQDNQIKHGLEWIAHGSVNVLRSIIEKIPVYGNIACLIYDLSAKRFEYQML